MEWMNFNRMDEWQNQSLPRLSERKKTMPKGNHTSNGGQEQRTKAPATDLPSELHRPPEVLRGGPDLLALPSVSEAYCDGGLIGVNPSPTGGTWAYMLVNADKDEALFWDCGHVTPESMGLPPEGKVTNNHTELLAFVKMLEALPYGWEGLCLTDSLVTMSRVAFRKPDEPALNVPAWLHGALITSSRRLGWFRIRLLDGHPTVAQLQKGVGKRGSPVSRFNVICDKMCKEMSKAYRSTQGEETHVA